MATTFHGDAYENTGFCFYGGGDTLVAVRGANRHVRRRGLDIVFSLTNDILLNGVNQGQVSAGDFLFSLRHIPHQFTKT